MKALFICLDYYPQNGACTSLLNKLLFEGKLQKSIGEVHVLTVKTDDTDSNIDRFNGVTVHRCLPPVLLTKADIMRLLPRKPILALQSVVLKLGEETRKRFCPKGQIFKKNVVTVLTQKLRQLEAENYDVIIPVCGHYEAAVAALKYAEVESVPITLYQVDPFASNRRFGGKKQVIRELEEKLYKAAAAIITTPIIYQEIRESYSQEIAKKTQAMEFPNVSMETAKASEQRREGIICLFAGSLYALARNPRYTIELFRRLHDSRIQLVFAGSDRKQVCEFVEEKEIAGNMSFLGKLPLEKAQEEIANADILVNIGNIMTNQVPSKIFEYISSGKPIINICVNQNCPSIPYLEKYPLALSIVEGVGTPEEHSAQIEKFIIENAGRTVDKAIILERFKECTAEYCARQMTHVLTNVNYK